jgi:hypothetical protein
MPNGLASQEREQFGVDLIQVRDRDAVRRLVRP